MSSKSGQLITQRIVTKSERRVIDSEIDYDLKSN